jgi:RimJ/RimL family protein N-acetyltransferase
MSHIPTLYTPRLILRPFTVADGPRVQELAGNPRIATNITPIADPCPNGDADSWISLQQISAKVGFGFDFAITLAGTRTPSRELDPADTGHLIGAISIHKYREGVLNQAGIGFWIGVPYWNKGFATEAGHSVLELAFGRCKYDRVISGHSADNLAAGRVLQKLGLILQPDTHPAEKWGCSIERVDYALTRDAWTRHRIVHRWKVTPCHPLASL